MTSAGRRRLANASLLIGSSALAILVFELGVRLIEPQPAYQYRFSPTTFYEPIPNARFVHEREEFSIPITYNAYGMRDRPRTLEKAPGALRVALVGDSFAEGKEVPLDSTVAQCLERRLSAAFPERTVEVLDFGVAGFGTAASTIRFETLGARFRPNLAIYLFVHNDPSDNVGRDARLYTVTDGHMEFRTFRLSPMRRAARSVIDWVKQNMHSYRFVRFRIDRALAARAARRRGVAGDEAFADAEKQGSSTPSEEAWTMTRLAVERLRDSVRGAGATLLVAQATTAGDSMTGRIAAICEQVGVPFIDLVPALEADPGPVTFKTDGHWCARGHDVAAAALAPAVTQILRSEARR
jgi:acetyltransferase AlgX (SGNH hydrolase-like protein)